MSWSSLACLAGVLDQAQNALSLLAIGQNHVHQREQIDWAQRGHNLDAQSLRLDALDHAKEEIRSHYDTYAGRLDTLLLALALIWPFALNVIQFSDPFVPASEIECPDCIQGQHPWLIGIWVGLIGSVLVLPFWGILMLIRCKIKLDTWLEQCWLGLNQERRGIMRVEKPQSHTLCSFAKTLSAPLLYSRKGINEEQKEREEETKKIVNRVVTVVLQYQENLAKTWSSECGWLVHTSTMLLWMSAVAALSLASLSMWIFFVNKGGSHAYYSTYFGIFIIFGGCVVPAVYIARQKWMKHYRLGGDSDRSIDDNLVSTSPLVAQKRQTANISLGDQKSTGNSHSSRPARDFLLLGVQPQCGDLA